ncbi:MAG: hypothetical protein HAW67_01350 [Endozoicomonadaceae bacterium]|nr:hypothetical protein [Endozoicomonadaceae bacterium]
MIDRIRLDSRYDPKQFVVSGLVKVNGGSVGKQQGEVRLEIDEDLIKQVENG